MQRQIGVNQKKELNNKPIKRKVMYCKNCGKEVDANAIVCLGCGCVPADGNKFCPNCGAETQAGQIVCLKCGVALGGVAAPAANVGDKSRVTAALRGIFLGGSGAHQFYLGHNKSGLIRLAIGIVGLCIMLPAASIIGLIEGIIYLTKSDEEFQKTYVVGGKEWF